MNNIKIDTSFSTDNNLIIEINSCIKILLDLDNEIKTNTKNSKLIIDSINNTNYEFPFDVPTEIKKIHVETQYLALMNQIKDTYGRLLRLDIKPETLNYLLPLSYKLNATLHTTKDDLNRLSSTTNEVKNLLNQINEQLNKFYE